MDIYIFLYYYEPKIIDHMMIKKEPDGGFKKNGFSLILEKPNLGFITLFVNPTPSVYVCNLSITYGSTPEKHNYNRSLSKPLRSTWS